MFIGLKETGTSIQGAWTAIKNNTKSKKRDSENRKENSVSNDSSISHSEAADSISSTDSNNTNMESKDNSGSGPSDAVVTEQPSASTNDNEINQDKTKNSMNLPIADDLTINPPKTNDPTIQSNPMSKNSQPNINNPAFTANPINTNSPTNTNTSNIINNTNVSCTPITNINANIVFDRTILEPQQVSGSSRNDGQLQSEPQTATLEWISSNPRYATDLMNRAIVAGKDIDGSDIWVIKTMIEGEDRPAKFSTGKREAFVALLSGKEKRIYQFDVCCVPSGKKIPITWKRASNEDFPDNAVTAGETSDGEPFYIGRQLVGRSRCPGMIRPDDKILYLSYGHEVYEYETYDVLCIS